MNLLIINSNLMTTKDENSLYFPEAQNNKCLSCLYNGGNGHFITISSDS